MIMPSTSSSRSAIKTTSTVHAARPKVPTGLKVVIVFFYFHLLLVVFPAWSFFQYDMVASFHLEEPRFLADEAVVQTNRAIGLTNLVLVIPLNLLAIGGLMLPYFRSGVSMSSPSPAPPVWGLVTSYMLLGVALYWPTLFLTTRLTYGSANIDHVKLGTSDATTVALVIVFALWSTWYLSTSVLSDVIHGMALKNHDEDELRRNCDFLPPEGSAIFGDCSTSDDANYGSVL